MIKFEKFMLCQEGGDGTGGGSNTTTPEDPIDGETGGDDSQTGGYNNSDENTKDPEQGKPIEPIPTWGFGGLSLGDGESKE